MHTTRKIAITALLALSACRRETADLGMSDSAFVKVMSELKQVADEAAVEPAVRAQRREAVLRKRGVSADEIEGLAATLTAHPQHAKRLWAEIEKQTQALLTKRPMQ